MTNAEYILEFINAVWFGRFWIGDRFYVFHNVS